MDWVQRGGPRIGSTGVIHGLGPQGWSMDWVHRGGPWIGSRAVVHGPGPQGWSMDPRSMFCIYPPLGLVEIFLVYHNYVKSFQFQHHKKLKSVHVNICTFILNEISLVNVYQ